MKTKKRAVTLIEIMIVILLIGLIGGALAFNMRGSLDQGKVFKTEQTLTRIHDILNLELAKGYRTPDDIVLHWQDIVRQSPLVKQGPDVVVDAWKKPFKVSLSEDGYEVIVQSEGLEAHRPKA